MSSLEECLGRAKDFYKDVKAKGGQKKLDTALQMFKEVGPMCPSPRDFITNLSHEDSHICRAC